MLTGPTVLPTTCAQRKIAASKTAIRALLLRVGESATVDVALFSEGPTERRWNVRAEDSAVLTGGSRSLSFTWDKTQGQNGDRLHLTITMEAPPARFVESFVIFSSVGGQGSTWMGLVALKS